MGCVRRMMTGQGRDEGRVLEDRLQIDGPMYTSRFINTGLKRWSLWRTSHDLSCTTSGSHPSSTVGGLGRGASA